MVAARVAAAARDLQAARANACGVATNVEANGAAIELQDDARAFAEQAAERLRLSARGLTRVPRVSRTVADLGGAGLVQRADVAEALAYRHGMPGQPFRQA